MAASVDGFKYSGEPRASDPAWRVVIAPAPSRRLRAWIHAVFAASLACVLAAPMPLPVQAAAAVALAGLALRAARRDAWHEGPYGVRRFAVDLAGRVEADFADGTRAIGRLHGSSFVMPWLTVVRWRPDGARLSRAFVVVPDAVEDLDFRRLRVLLRWR